MLEKKPKGKYVAGFEPWTIMGIKEATWYPTIKRERERGLFNGPAHRALQRALDIAAGTIVPNPVEAPVAAPAEPASAIEAPVVPTEPEPTEAPVMVAVAAARTTPEPTVTIKPSAMVYQPAASLSAPSEPPPPAVAGAATVFVSFRCPVDIHERMREMAHRKRASLQGIVGAAVAEYLSQNGF